MSEPSNLPPGVTNAMIEEQAGDDERDYNVNSANDEEALEAQAAIAAEHRAEARQEAVQESLELECEEKGHDWGVEESYPGDRVVICNRCGKLR